MRACRRCARWLVAAVVGRADRGLGGASAARAASAAGRSPARSTWSSRSAAPRTRRSSSGSWSHRTNRCARRPFIVHNIEATRAAFGLDKVDGAAALGRGAPDPRRSRAQRGDDRERAALERPAAARHVRAAPGDPDVLRLRRGGQRPLHDRRQVPADHAVGARAELAEPAEPHVDQRAAHVHPRLRPDAGPGQRGHAAKGCRCCSSGTCRRSRRRT